MKRKRGLGRLRRRRNRRVDRSLREDRRQRIRRAARVAILGVALGFGSWHLARLAEARRWLDGFRVREVKVVGAEITHPNVLVAEAGLMGARLHWWSDLEPYVARVKRDPMIAEARFRRRFPNGLALEVVEREPIAFVELDRLAPVDSAGRVLPVDPFHTEWNVPILTAAWPAAAMARDGRIAVEEVGRALAILGEVARRYPALSREISAVALDRAGTLTLRLVHGDGAIVLDVTTPVEKLALIDDVLKDLREKGLDYRTLDLRFDDQIVVRRG